MVSHWCPCVCRSVCLTSASPYFHFWTITGVNIDGFSLSASLYFCFWTITLVNVDGFSPNLLLALILLGSSLALQMGKFSQFFT